jgi:hypothetical protein
MTMSVHNVEWTHCLHLLREAPANSFERRLGMQLAHIGDDRALTLLIEIVTENPCGTTEYVVAAHLLHHLVDRAA